MTARIFRKEFSELLQSGQYLWSSIVFLLLLVAGLYNGIGYYKVEKGRRDLAAEATYRQWLEQGEKNPHSAAHYGFYAYKPVSPLAVLDKGLDDYLGVTTWLEAHYQNETEARSVTDKLGLSRFGDLTIGLLLVFFAPLFIVLLGYNLVSSEKENGTLRMIFSTRATSARLLWGKSLALLAAVAVWLAVSLGIMVVVLVLLGVSLSHVLLPVLIVFLALLVMYAAISAGVVALSAQSNGSATALVSGMAIWMLAAILIPRLNGSVTERVFPAPSAFAFQQMIDHDKESGVDGHSPASERNKAFREEVLRKYGVDSISQLPVNFSGLSLQTGEEDGNKVYDKNYSALYATLQQQDKLMAGLSLLSPLAATRNLVFGFAGTDLHRHEAFVQQAEIKRRTIQKLLNEDYAYGGAGKTAYTRGEDLWGQVSNFRFQEPAVSVVAGQQVLNMLVLMVWLLLAGVLLVFSAKKLKPFSA